jgi:hypothetical protein
VAVSPGGTATVVVGRHLNRVWGHWHHGLEESGGAAGLLGGAAQNRAGLRGSRTTGGELAGLYRDTGRCDDQGGSSHALRMAYRAELNAALDPAPGIVDWLNRAAELGFRLAVSSSSPISKAGSESTAGRIQNSLA